jgi:hypothetical protein
MMWLAGWAVRVLLLITAPIYYLCRAVAGILASLDEWSWKAIHPQELKKPPQSDTPDEQPQARERRILR